MTDWMTTRRRFLGSSLAVAAAAQMPAFAAGPQLALPTADQLAWQDLEVGMFIHFAPNTWQDKEGDNLSTPLSAINPQIDTDNWAQCAVNLGARYIVFVAKHIGGFCMWQTQTTTYSIAHTPWKNGKGDVLEDLSASCKKFGLGLGVYLSPRDDNFGAGGGGHCKDPAKQDVYNQMYRTQLTEVLSRYGSMVEMWFDGSNIVPVADILQKYAPHAAVFQGPSATIRWVGNEDGFSPSPLWNAVARADAKSGTATSLLGDPDGEVWLPVEADVSIRRPNWFWSTTNVKKLMTLDDLLEVYYRSVGRGSQLLLNIPADRRGLMPDEDFARAKEFGDELRHRFKHSIAEMKGAGRTFNLPLARTQHADHVVLQEECRYGQRIRAYTLEGNIDGTWSTLYSGNSIGQKRIIPITPNSYIALRLTITESSAPARIRRFAAYNTLAEPPKNWDAPASVWSANAVGRWTDSKFDLDLSKKITAATQYRLRFLPASGTVNAVENVQLLVNGVLSPQLVRPVRGSKNVLMLDMTEIPQKTSISGTISGADKGTIVLEKQ
jgi:alpha-L-fucosidase